MRGLHSLQPAAALLLILAAVVVQHPQAAANGGALDEGTIMRRLRRLANDAGMLLACTAQTFASTPAGYGH